LARTRDRSAASLDNSRRRGSEVLGDGLLDVLDRTSFLQRQQVLERFLRKIQRDRSPGELRIGVTRRNAPSSSRTFERMRLATKNATSSGARRSRPSLAHQMATQVSSSGGSIATVRPHRIAISGALRDLALLRITIAGQDHLLLAFEQRVERVENSSCERSLPAKNCMSSISSASSVRYAV